MRRDWPLLHNIPLNRVVRRIQQQRADRYPLLREFYRGEEILTDNSNLLTADNLRSVPILSGTQGIGNKLSELTLKGVAVSSLVRKGKRKAEPLDAVMIEGDVVLWFGAPMDLDYAEKILIATQKNKRSFHSSLETNLSVYEQM